VPLYVQFGLETFRDRVDLSDEEFYSRLKHSNELPKTSQPHPADFVQVYRLLTSRRSQVVSIHPIAQFSGTYNTALLARSMMHTPEHISVIDSRSGSAGQLLVVLEAARAALKGLKREQITELVSEMRSKVRVYVGLETLSYLARNGRIGKAHVLMASMLNVKPMISVIDGEIGPVGRARGSSAMLARLVEMCADLVKSTRARVAITHAGAQQQAIRLCSQIESKLGLRDTVISSMCPAVVSNAGPGAIAVAVYEPELS
jgi:DegV family protein with EDD domain